MAFKMKGFSGFVPPQERNKNKMINKGGPTKQPVDPDAPGTPGTPGFEPPVKRSDLDAEGKKIWDSKAATPKKVKHKDLEKVVDELQGAVKAHGRQAKTIDKHIDDMAGMPKKGKCSCYDGHSRVKGTAPCAPGSCKKSPASKKLKPCQKAAARRKFDVYPSAYANMWASNHKC